MNHKIIVKTNGNINNDNSAPNLIYLVSVQITKLKESMHDFHMNNNESAQKEIHLSEADLQGHPPPLADCQRKGEIILEGGIN